ncbi:MAG: choice-of-anchor tandem repeat NxxGxxAF-containing protein [Phycisphaerales bacterium JB039]
MKRIVIASAAAPLALACAAGHAQDVRYQFVALTGDPAPGLVDVTFARLSSPRINDRGQIVLVSELAGAVTDADNGALWAGEPGALGLILRKGAPAPITAPAGEPVNYVAFPFPALNPDGVIAFTGSTADLAADVIGPDAIFVQTALAFEAVAQAYYPPTAGYFDSLPVAPLTPEAQAAFNTGRFGEAYLGDPGGLDRLLGSADPAPATGAGFEVDFVDLPQVGPGGNEGLRASVGDPAERFDRYQSLWRRTTGDVELVAWAEARDPAPGEILFSDFGVAPYVGPGGEMIFWASVRGDTVTELNDAAIWSDAGGAPEAILREGDHVTGLGADVGVGRMSRQIAINDFGQMALMTSLVGLVDPENNTAIIGSADGDEFTVLVREGDAAPGAPAGAVFHSLSDPAINHAGQIAFLAQLRGGGLELDEKFGLYATDRQGQLHEIARTGTLFDVRGDGTDIREIRQIEWASDAARTGHSQFAFDGSLAVLLTFEGWDSGIYIASVGCLADTDGDGELTFFDYLEFLNQFSALDPRADLDVDRQFTFFDFLAYQNLFAAGCS